MFIVLYLYYMQILLVMVVKWTIVVVQWRSHVTKTDFNAILWVSFVSTCICLSICPSVYIHQGPNLGTNRKSWELEILYLVLFGTSGTWKDKQKAMKFLIFFRTKYFSKHIFFELIFFGPNFFGQKITWNSLQIQTRKRVLLTGKYRMRGCEPVLYLPS